MKRPFSPTCLALGLALLCPSTLAWAQVDRVSLRGKVVDAQGEPLPDAEVTLEFTGESRNKIVKTQKTDKHGMFIRVGLRQGPYVISIAKEGYAPYSFDTYFSPGLTELPAVTLGKAQPKQQQPAAPAVEAPTQQELAQAMAEQIGAKYGEASAALQAGDLAGAEALFNEVILEAPELGPAHYQLGYLYLQQERIEEAEAAFRKTIATQPDDSTGYVALAGLLTLQQRVPEALELLADAAPRFEADAAFQYELGITYLNVGETNKGGEALTRVTQLDPGKVEALYYLGTVALQSGDTAGAIARLEEYLAKEPSNAENAETARGLIAALKGSQ